MKALWFPLLLCLGLTTQADDNPKPAPLTREQVNRGLFILAAQRLDAAPQDPAARQLMQLAALADPTNAEIKSLLERVANGKHPNSGLYLEDNGELLVLCLLKTAEALPDNKAIDKGFIYTVASLAKPGSVSPELLAKYKFQISTALPEEADTIAPDEIPAKKPDPDEEKPDITTVEQVPLSALQEDALGLLESVKLPNFIMKTQFAFDGVNQLNRAAAPLGISVKLDDRLKQMGMPFTESKIGNVLRYSGSKAHMLNRDINLDKLSNASELIKYWDYTTRMKYKITGKLILLTDSKGCEREDIAEFIYNASTLDDMRTEFYNLNEKEMIGNMVQVRGTLTAIDVTDESVTVTLNNFLKATLPVKMFKFGTDGIDKLKKAKGNNNIVLRGRLQGQNAETLHLREVVDVLDDATPYFFTR
jgi:hypothetical protein